MSSYSIIETFINNEDGLTAHLLMSDDWAYGCTFKDTDSGEVIQTRHGYKTAADALAKIGEFLNGTTGGFAPAL